MNFILILIIKYIKKQAVLSKHRCYIQDLTKGPNLEAISSCFTANSKTKNLQYADR